MPYKIDAVAITPRFKRKTLTTALLEDCAGIAALVDAREAGGRKLVALVPVGNFLLVVTHKD